jgi:hypothetical protein
LKVDPTKNFIIRYWDISQNKTKQIGEANTLDEAIQFVEQNYKLTGENSIEVIDRKGEMQFVSDVQ